MTDDFTRGYPTREAALAAIAEFRSAVATAEVVDLTGRDLVTFLRARLDERERLAHEMEITRPPYDFVVGINIDGNAITYNPYDPAYVLADIAAKRRLVEILLEVDEFYTIHREAPAGERFALWTAVKLAAAPFRDHPDWDPAWEVT